jgi:hypothetical protein
MSRLRAALQAEGGLLGELAERAGPESEWPPGPAQIAAAGPRAADRAAEYEVLLEMILEGSCLHYGPTRLIVTEDADLALLLGDQLYALGLARLATIGDLFAIGELADVISLIAQASASRDEDLAGAVWEAGAVAIGWGSSRGHAQAKALARSGEPAAAAALRQAAETQRGSAS